MAKVAILIDGGHLRVLCRLAGKHYTPDYVELVAHACVNPQDEWVLRVLYYDCAPYNGEVALPVSGNPKIFDQPDMWLQNLAKKDYFAVRRGVLKFRGWKPAAVPVPPQVPTDDDFEPLFEQKGVDMRIGLDVATFAETKAVDRLLLITNDTDCVPAMKHARKAGLQVALVTTPRTNPATELVMHSDFRRPIAWP